MLGVREGTALYTPSPDARTRVVVGDESALPAIARILEEGGAAETQAFVEVADAAERQELSGRVTWVERAGARPGVELFGAVRRAAVSAAVDEVWVCGERWGVQEIRRHLIERGVAKERIVFSGYWRLGEARG